MKTTMITIVLLALLFNLAAAQQQSCASFIPSLASCLSFLQGQAASPDTNCCIGLRTMNAANASCLCDVASMAGSPQLPNLNTTRALELPARCNIPNVDASTCSLGGAPLPAPGANAPPPENGGTPPSAAMSISSPSWLVFAAVLVGCLSLKSVTD